MPSILTSCRSCGREFVPDRRAIVAGTWRPDPVVSRQGGEPVRGLALRLLVRCCRQLSAMEEQRSWRHVS